MKKARFVCQDHILVNGMVIHVEKMNYAHKEWIERNGLQETETVETEKGDKFIIFANYARCLACAIPVND